MTINQQFRDLIPPLTFNEQSRLEAQLLLEGCRDALVTWNGTLVDGHNRFEICTRYKLPFKTREMEFESELHAKLWIRVNQLSRRNLTDDQRAMIADAAAELESKLAMKERAAKGTPAREAKKTATLGAKASTKVNPNERTRAKVSKASKVSVHKMKKARLVRKKSPALARQVEAGEITLTKAVSEIARLDRRKSLQEMAWPEGKFRVIYADPPWPYNDKRLGSVSGGGATGTYDTESLEAICRKNVAAISMDDSVLFLWITSPLLPDGLETMRRWGFTYKASFVWDKVQGFNGHYNDVRHEILLVGTRGSCLPEITDLPDSVIEEKKERHSQKPAVFRELIDRLYPSGPRVELYAREKMKGWTAWGNEAF
jgi:N6-adenosine-specific RNA methylase IME4